MENVTTRRSYKKQLFPAIPNHQIAATYPETPPTRDSQLTTAANLWKLICTINLLSSRCKMLLTHFVNNLLQL
jgi:hypothetical protein